jgi:cytochrome c
MKSLQVVLITVVAVGMLCSIGFAAEKGNADKGKALFNDAKFAGGQKACGECHPNGKGIEKTADKKEFKTQNALEKQVNACIVGASKGKAIDPKSAEMADIVAYIKSLK